MNVVPFDFDGASVRVVMRDGEPWFVAADVCAVLEHSNVTVALESVEEYQRAKESLALANGQEVNLVSESGLYALIFRSRKVEAKRFQRWVFEEVLPSIRKTGGYGDRYAIPNNKTAIAAVEFEAYKRVADAFGLSRNAALIAADNAVARDYGISFKEKLQITLQADGNEVPMLVSAIGAELGIGGGVQKRGKVVNDMLAGMGLQVKSSNGEWMPTEAGAPYAFVAQTGKKHRNGTPVTQVKWRSSIIPLIQAHME